MKKSIIFWLILCGVINVMRSEINQRTSPGRDGMIFLFNSWKVTEGRYLNLTATLKCPPGKLQFVSASSPHAEGDQYIYEPTRVFWMLETTGISNSYLAPILSHHMAPICHVLVSEYRDAVPVTFAFSLERDSLASLLKSDGPSGNFTGDVWIRFGVPVERDDPLKKELVDDCILYTERIKLEVNLQSFSVGQIENGGLEYKANSESGSLFEKLGDMEDVSGTK